MPRESVPRLSACCFKLAKRADVRSIRSIDVALQSHKAPPPAVDNMIYIIVELCCCGETLHMPRRNTLLNVAPRYHHARQCNARSCCQIGLTATKKSFATLRDCLSVALAWAGRGHGESFDGRVWDFATPTQGRLSRVCEIPQPKGIHNERA